MALNQLYYQTNKLDKLQTNSSFAIKNLHKKNG